MDALMNVAVWEKLFALTSETGQQRVVRHGHLPEREIITGIGPVAVR